MNETLLQSKLNILLSELEKSENKKQSKLILAKAVQLGMQYQELKIKQGIKIVFDELHKK